MGLFDSPTKENEAPTGTDSASKQGNTPPSRDSLSWQRRPASRGGSRPLSMVAAQNASQRFSAKAQDPISPAAEQQHLSREDIARTLGLKDPSWFRQTDRGQGSAAYRKNQVEDDEKLDMSAMTAQLPGMTPIATTQRSPERSPERSSFISPSQAKLASPIPLDPPRQAEREAFRTPMDTPLADSPSGRSSPTRSPSPTKGMGGFVQSAMLKRSDSIKRWSVTSPPSLSRADSVTANIGNRNSASSSPRQKSFLRQDSAPNVSQDHEDDIKEDKEAQASADAKLPVSPSKTMDSRRWSPTKSSWLDSALNRPESPNPQSRHVKSPSAHISRPESPHKQVNVGGLMRSTPFEGGGRTNTTGLGGIYSPPPGGNRPPMGHGSKPSFSRLTTEPEPEQEPELVEEEMPAQQTPTSADAVAKRSSVASPPAVKPKPDTPPKKDFRSTLKSRVPDAGPKKDEEPEFRNALGNLRRAKTQNYVAPDELKHNIMRGKAALNTTGGPQKTARTDEFKDAILKKRQDFKTAQTEGRGVTRTPTVTEAKIPEGLARRAELGKPSTTSKPAGLSKPSSQELGKKPASPNPVTGSKRIPSQTDSPASSASKESPQANKTQPRRVSTGLDSNKPSTSPRSAPSVHKETSAPSRLQQERAGSGRLADRFNPGLAGMLAKGPPPMAKNGGQKPDEPQSAGSGTAASTTSTEASAPGPQLTHMTKGRARGPRRKAPSSAPKASEVAPESQSVSKPATELKSIDAPAKSDEPPKLSIQEQVAAKAVVSRGNASSPSRQWESKSEVSKISTSDVRSPDVRSPDVRSPSSVKTPIQSPSTKQESPAEKEVSQPSSPRKLDMKRMSRFLAEDTNSDGNANVSIKPKETPSPTQAPAEEPKPVHTRPPEPKAPIATPEPKSQPSPSQASPHITSPLSREQRERSREATPSIATPSRRFDSIKSPSPERRPTLHGPRPPRESPRPKSRGAVRPLSGLSNSGQESPSAGSPARSPVKQPNEITSIFNDFFGPPRPRQDFKVDPAEVLMNRPAESVKVNSSDVQMIRLAGDGKKSAVQQQNERVLFEEEMYIVAHNFVGPDGKKALEVYFWIGDEVPDAEASDAHLFAAREARAIGGKLVKLYQGKETTEFLQALGGVIIVRRGSSSRFDSLAPHMLCGRRFLNQVAFDETDVATTSLCTGFVYIISHSGKCYLWKGKGAGIDELSAAKLVGMELALSGEYIEIEEGAEPAAFWEVFDGGNKPYSADHWRLKPNYSKYGSRLFCSDADARKQVRFSRCS